MHTFQQVVSDRTHIAGMIAQSIPERLREHVAEIPPGRVSWTELVPGGAHWSWHLSRGTSVRFVALDDRANCAVVLYAAHDRTERYSMPDSCKAQHTTHFTQGNVLMSDMGRSMVSVTADTLGAHDGFGMLLDTARMEQQYGEQRYQESRNAMHRSGKDGLLIEIGKYGLSARDLIAPVNLFTKVAVDQKGRFSFNAAREVKGSMVELRCDMDLVMAISTAPHPLDTRPGYQPGKIGVIAWQTGAAPEDDFCRHYLPECGRALHYADLLAVS